MEPTPTPLPILLTAGRLAAQLRVPLHRVTYLLRTRRHIQPKALAGKLRLYDREAIPMLRHELSAIDARRGEGVRLAR